MSEPERIYERTICKLLCFNLFWNVIYSGDAKLNLQHHYCGKSEIILICCSINISSYYQCWKHSLPCNCGHSDAPLPARMLVLCYVLYGSTSTLWIGALCWGKRKEQNNIKDKAIKCYCKDKGLHSNSFSKHSHHPGTDLLLSGWTNSLTQSNTISWAGIWQMEMFWKH